MSFLDIFKPTKESPKVKGVSFGSQFSISYDTSAQVFYSYYEFNPYIASCVNKIKGDVGSHGYEMQFAGKPMKDNVLFKKLVEINGYTPKKFFERLIRDYEITGNCYVYIVRNVGGNQTIGLQPLDPRYMKPITDTKGQILGYLQNLDGIRTFTKDEVFHLREDSDLKNETLGKSKMQSLFIDLETDKEAKESNLAFFKNNQTPASVMLVDPDFEVADTTKWLNELKTIFESGKYTGGSNRHRSAFLEGIKEIVKIQDKISDMEFIEMRRFTMELTCSIFGVPKDVLGFTDTSNRSVGENQSENYYMMIEEKEEMFAEFLTSVLKIALGPEYGLVFLQDNLRALTKKSVIAGDLFEKGLINRNEAREIIQYKPVKDGETFKEDKPKEAVVEKKVSKGK